MAHRKRRVTQHMMEDQSLRIIGNTLPKEWVVRDYKPDYGIDIAVEIFERSAVSESVTETVGEWFFAQVKSVKKTKIKRRRVYPRYNVEKKSLQEDKDKSLTIDTIPYQIDTDELLTVQSLGSGVPVLLLLVTLDTNKLYFVCLNDLIDKCILPSDENFATKKTKSIPIPVQNIISSDQESLTPIKFIAKRQKLYSAFSKFSYQEHEVNYLRDKIIISPTGDILDFSAIDTLLHFLKVIRRYDFWKTTSMWKVVSSLHEQIIKTEWLLRRMKTTGRLSTEDLSELIGQGAVDSVRRFDLDLQTHFATTQITDMWSRLKILNNIYEELCREWFLPTYLGAALHPGDEGMGRQRIEAPENTALAERLKRD